jgi:molybdate transport system permease protein
MNLSAEDFQAIALTLQLASVTTVLLLLLATPVAWWLAHTRSAWRAPVASLVALPFSSEKVAGIFTGCRG